MKTWTDTMATGALAAVLTLAACQGSTGGVIEATQSPEEVAAAEMAEAWAAAYSAHVGSERPARVVLGTWTHIAESGESWSARLAAGMEKYARQGLEQFPDAPRLLHIFPNGGNPSVVTASVVDRENTQVCCPLFYVDVQLNEGLWEVRALDLVGDSYPGFPKRMFEWTIEREAEWR